MIDYLMDGSRRFSKLAGISFLISIALSFLKECFTETQRISISQMLSDNVDKLNSWRCSLQYYHKLQTAIEN